MRSPERSDLDEAVARTADGAFAIGSAARIVLWNRAAEKMLGHSAREAIGRPCCDLFVGYDPDEAGRSHLDKDRGHIGPRILADTL